MYFLAEDRVASERIIKIRTPSESTCCCNHGYYLRFVKQAKASTDGPRGLKGLLEQRRRWNNGAWFSLIHTIFLSWTVVDLFKSGHNAFALLLLAVQFIYYTLVVAFTWFSLGAYYFAFVLAANVFVESKAWLTFFRTFIVFLDYIVLCLALGVNLKYMNERIWWVLCVLYALTFCFILCSLGYYLFINRGNELLIIGVILLPLIILLQILLYCEDFKKLVRNACPYIAMIPTYANIFLLFSICKTDDITWGTRNNLRQQKPKGARFKLYKMYYLLSFVLSNLLFAFWIERSYIDGVLYPIYSLYIVTLVILILPLFGEIIYLIQNIKVSYEVSISRKIRPLEKSLNSNGLKLGILSTDEQNN